MSVNQLVMFMILFLNYVSWGLLVNCQWWTFIWNYYFWRGHIFLMLLFCNMWRDLGMWTFVGYGSDMILSASINWKFGSVFAISQAWLFLYLTWNPLSISCCILLGRMGNQENKWIWWLNGSLWAGHLSISTRCLEHSFFIDSTIVESQYTWQH